MKLALASLPLLALACGCPGGGGYNRPGGGAPTVDDIVAKLDAKRAALSSFSSGSVMDYWLGDQRLKGEVLVMGKPGAKVRFAALSPAGGDTIVDMACDGTNFKYIDKQNNCALQGPCDRTSIATFLRVELEPEDFVGLALGHPPALPGAKGTATWDGKAGVDRVELVGPGGKQSLVIDEKNGVFDVVEVKVFGPDGKLAWSVTNYGFKVVADAKGNKARVPTTTHLESPQQKADLKVEWKGQDPDPAFNPDIDDARFAMEIPAGLPQCGAKPQTAGAQTP